MQVINTFKVNLSFLLNIFPVFLVLLFSSPLQASNVSENSVSVFKIDENDVEIPTNELTIESKVIQKVKPLLNYIFFDYNSFEIPNNFKQINPQNIANFNVNNYYYADNLELYYHILNIVGQRMIVHPNKKITLVACTSKDEKNKNELAEKRASSIKNYLINVWKINANRIKTESRLSPISSSGANSNENDPFYIQRMEEDRRVEIYEEKDDNLILGPVIISDTTSFSTPDYFRFKFNISNIENVRYWEFIAGKLKYTRDKNYLGNQFVIPQSIDWFVDENESALPKESESLKYYMKVVYNDGFVYQTENKLLSVVARYNPIPYYTIENGLQTSTFHLIFFEFNKSNLQKADLQTIEYIKDKIKPNSNVIITGFTDNIGDIDYNNKLSLERANSVSNLLKSQTNNFYIKNFSGTNNSTPEQRFYNRTVIVRIETPLEDTE